MIWLYDLGKFENLMKSYFTKLILMIIAIISLFLNLFDKKVKKHLYFRYFFENYCKIK